MPSKYALTPPEMMVGQKEGWVRYLAELLRQPNMASRINSNLLPEQCPPIYVDGIAVTVLSGHWQWDGSRALYMARGNEADSHADGTVHNLDRLAVIALLAGAADVWGSIAEAFATALNRELCAAVANANPLVVSERKCVEVAFTADEQQAGVRYDGDDQWYTYIGAPLDVDNTWRQIKMPVTVA